MVWNQPWAARIWRRRSRTTVRLPKRPVIEQLVRTLAYPTTPPHTRQAIAWVLQRVFDLSTPPVDPITGEPVSERGISYLTNLARRLPE